MTPPEDIRQESPFRIIFCLGPQYDLQYIRLHKLSTKHARREALLVINEIDLENGGFAFLQKLGYGTVMSCWKTKNNLIIKNYPTKTDEFTIEITPPNAQRRDKC